MANIQKIFNEEIRRLAKKEVKSATGPLRSQIAQLRKQVAEQKQLIKKLEQNPSSSAESVPSANNDDASFKKLRMSSARIRKIRKICGVTQAQMAQLLGVSHSAVVKWEIDKAQPREGMKANIVALVKMGKRELRKRLEALSAPNAPEQD